MQKQMKVARAVLRSLSYGVSRQLHRPPVTRHFSVFADSGDRDGDKPNSDSSESINDFTRRMFGDVTESGSKNDAFFRKFDQLHQGRSDSRVDSEGDSGTWDWGDSYDSLDDGMDDKLKREATYFEYNSDECDEEDYSFRPDMNFQPGMTYDVQDLDLRRPGVFKPTERPEFEVTTREVLRKADFRNVRFLANFITEAGIIIKRSKTGISAKAQRKIAREIKTARAFGLMPFTTMGTKSFAFGKSMENVDADYEYETYGSRDDAEVDGVFEAPNRRQGVL
ncbi:hypothetical protein CDL15_Pgr022486 [Punica granatum]|uniref:Small ribosomal subunit protein bS18c n=3 Tax=Punica granatum TaxID=22663 RepID=A0A218XQB0_PUNGR|nr:hypothetical protein CDL15_Pgr022486 [Punica granatum]